MIATVLAWAAAIALALLGLAAAVYPVPLATLYGASASEANGIVFVRAAGVRDAALAIVLGASVIIRDVPVFVVACCACALVAGADLTIVLRTNRGRLRPQYFAHLFGAIGFIVVAALAARAW